MKLFFTIMKKITVKIYNWHKNIKTEHYRILFKDKKYTKLIRIYNKNNKIIVFLQEKIKNNHFYKLPGCKYLQIDLYHVDSIKNFCLTNKLKYFTIEKRQVREIYIPHYYDTEESDKKIKKISPEIYLAEIKNANIIGENSVIIVDNYCLYDMAKYDKENRYDLRFSSIKNIDEKYAIVTYVESNEKIENAISLVGFASFNYYHLTIELLSRLQYIDSFKEYSTIPILIDEKVLNIPQYRDLLNAINKSEHPIIPIKKGKKYNVDKLIYPSYNSWLPINVKKREVLKTKDFLMSKSSIEYVRNTVLNNFGLKSSYGFRKIYISRIKVTFTRLKNEQKVIELFKKYNFEIIYPEELSFEEQVKLFAEAEYIAGTTGAAFTNTIYCASNVTVICIIPKRYKYYGYSTLLNLLDLKCTFLDCKVTSKEQTISSEQFMMDLIYCEKFLKGLPLMKKK